MVPVIIHSREQIRLDNEIIILWKMYLEKKKVKNQ